CAGAYAYTLVSFDAKIGPFDAVLAFVVYTIGGLFHELGHGFACQHYGGDVEEIGFMLFYYLRPSAYCDTTSSYIINRRHDKVVIQLAGVIASMIWCSTSAIVLALLYPSLPIYPALAIDLLIEVTFSFVTLVPLLKLDGYYAICDYFNFPNLRDRAFKVTRAWLARLLFGLHIQTETVTPRVRGWLIAYGIAAFTFTVWFIYMAYSSLLVWVVEHGRVMGLIAAVLLTTYLGNKIVLRPLWKGIGTLIRERKQIFTLRRTPVLMLLAAMLVVPWFVPWPVRIDADFEIVPAARAEVRAQVAGRLEEIYVVEGQHVTAGQPIAKLRDVELHARVTVLEAKLEAAQQRATQLRAGARVEEIAVARSHAAHEAAVVYDDAQAAEHARELARAQVGTQSAADLARGREAETAGSANAAKAALALVENGPREEEIRVADADVASLKVELERDRTDEDRLVLNSPIDGTVVTPHLSNKLQTTLAAGDLVAEIHDQRSDVAEIKLPPATPLGEIAIGNRARLRAKGIPDGEIDTRVERVRQAVQKDQLTIVMTAPFTLYHPVSGLTGHARIYGEKRSIAYSVIYLPLRRLIGVQLWSL
ncbi:MAG TPA: HlyD family efflux transporter periplasmic adaptor subunit, partial [Kofleriaceae bacterium]